MLLALLFHYLMLNMFRMLIHPSAGACDLFVELFHGLYCSGSMCVRIRIPCSALNNEIIKQVTSSWSLFIQLYSITNFPFSIIMPLQASHVALQI